MFSIQSNGIRSTGGGYRVTISSETPGTIRYTLDGNEPDQTSPAYSEELIVTAGTTLKARVYPANTVWDPSDVEEQYLPVLEAVDIPVDTVLPDGSVIVLDRGSSYGEYGLFDGYPMRMSAGEDDGSIESENWRYLIADSKDAADGRTRWGSKVVVGTELIGYSGLYNTDLMHANLGAEEDTIIYFTMERRNETGFKWFIPSNDEFVQMVGHQVPGISTDWYWTSCEVNITTAYIYTIQGTSTQLNKAYFGALLRLMRRI